MEKELSFHILGIEETKDERAIKMAYMERLKDTNPEDDPEGFKRLRSAYETAAAVARQPEAETVLEGEEEEKTEIEVWLSRIDECYLNVKRRGSVAEWNRLLEDPVCDGLDTFLEARELLLAYLMNHIHLPWAVWKALDRSFQIVEDLDVLEETFPKNFLEYAVYYVEHEGFIRFELFRLTAEKGWNADGYLDQYFTIKKKVDRGEFAGCMQELADLAAFGVYHPYEDVERIRILMAEEKIAEAAQLARKLEELYPGSLPADGKADTNSDSNPGHNPDSRQGMDMNPQMDPYISSFVGQVHYREGKKDEAYRIWIGVMKEYPAYYQAKFSAVKYLMEKERYWKAREWMMEILELDGRDEEVLKLLLAANEALIGRFRENPEYRETDVEVTASEGALELGWCLFQNERLEEAIDYLKQLSVEADKEYSYANLFGRVLYQAERYEEAKPWLERWLHMIQEITDDGTEENRKRRSRLGRAYYLLGACCFEMGMTDEAVNYEEKAAEATEEQQEKLGCLQYLAHIHSESKQYEKAVDVCDQIIKADENYYPAYLTRQEACYELKKGQEVVDDYHKAISIFPGFYKPYLLAAEVFFFHNQFEDAKEVIDLAKENQVEFSSRLKLFQVKILRNLARKNADRELPLKLCEELAEEIKGDTDIEDLSEVDFETALLHWDNDAFDKALFYMEEAIRKNGERLQYRMVRGNIYLDMEKYEEALLEYGKAESLYSDSPALYYNRGLCYEAKKMKVQAAENYEKALELKDGYRDACEKLSDYYRKQYEDQYRQEDYDRAIVWISRQVALTENCYYLVHRGLIHMNAMELDLAIDDFLKALTHNPTDWAAHNNLGCCYKYRCQFEQAIEYFEKAAECMEEKESLLPYSNMADCYEALFEYEKAIECYEKDLALFPDYVIFWKEIGLLYSYMGAYEKAEEAYRHMEQHDDYHSLMGDLWFRRGNLRKAASFYKKGVGKAEGTKKAAGYSDLGDFYKDQMLNYHKAVSCYKHAIAEETDQYQLFNYEEDLAQAYFLMKKYGDASEHAKKAMEHFRLSGSGTEEDYMAYKPYKPAREALMGWIYLMRGDKKRALELFGNMDGGYRCKGCRYPGCFEKYLYLGMYYEASEETKQALAAYEEALRLNPHSLTTKCVLENLQKKVKRQR